MSNIETIQILFKDCADHGVIEKAVRDISAIPDVMTVECSTREEDTRRYFAKVRQDLIKTLMGNIGTHDGVDSVSELFEKLSITLDTSGMTDGNAPQVFERRFSRLDGVSQVKAVDQVLTNNRDGQITMTVFAWQGTAMDRLQGQIWAASGARDARIQYEGLSPLSP